MKPKSTSKTPLNPSVNIAGVGLKIPVGGTNNGALSIPPIVHQNGDASSLNGTTLTTAASLWPTLDSCFYLDQTKTVTMIEQYVKTDLFHKLKFISSPNMLAFSWDKKSICQLICEKFKVARMEQTIFWSYYQNSINQKLNKKRAEVLNAMRRAFKGMLCH